MVNDKNPITDVEHDRLLGKTKPEVAVPAQTAEGRIIQILQEALAEAMEGKIKALALAAVAENGQYRTVFHGSAWMSTLVGVVAQMLHRMNEAMKPGARAP